MSNFSVYEEVTSQIVSELEEGVAPWVKPWTSGGTAFLPYNAVSQRGYRGVNVLLLWRAATQNGYGNPAWLTFNQAKELGGFVKRGEKGSHVVYASSFTKTEVDETTGEEEEKDISFLKFYTVFNVDQTRGLPQHLYQHAEPKRPEDALANVETFLRNIKADVRHGGDRAFYHPKEDFIVLPQSSDFENSGHYYATSLHEHAHWSGHESRLNRDLSGRFGDQSYAAEELVAELSAAFLCAHLSIPGELRHAEYIGSWIKLFQDDKRAIFTAASKATEAADYLRQIAEAWD